MDAVWLLLAVPISGTLAVIGFPNLTPGMTNGTYWSMGVLATIGLLSAIVLHVTAHPYGARHYGMPIRGITLFIFGGVAEMTAESSRQRDELLMAAAGQACGLTRVERSFGFVICSDHE